MTGILFGSFAVLAIIGLPIAVVLGLSSILALSTYSKIPLMVVAQRMFTATDSFPLMAIPFFMMAGALMETGGISRRLINLANKIVGGLPGGLALVGIVTCMFFAAISGSGPATVAAIGSILIPAMVDAGYDIGFAAAVMAAAGAIGVIIPPSIPMVTYGVVGGVSIGSIFLGGFGSGIVVGLSLLIVSYLISKKRGYRGSEKRSSFIDLLKAIKDAFWALLMPIIILGGIYGGIFTPTEAAAVAVVYGFLVGFLIYRELKIKDLPKIFVNTAVSTSVVMFIIATAQVFGWIMTSQRIPEAIAQGFINLSSNPYVILLLVNILLLIVGCFMETNAAIIILAPIFIPLMIKIGVDPILFGIIMVVNLAIGMVTPPLGVNLFVACGIGKLTLERISKAVVPFILAMVAALMLITYIPDISMFLPRMLMGGK
ncbi:TRAP transporter large permease [Thermoanaerobacterium sp. DL9XJH110]|uniref:TRAP transporter large permease n=1 Tax=Thermoanaerobacterium sp. DL9XJH110 TaxID=3386643 RepID=UPI003BB606A7